MSFTTEGVSFPPPSHPTQLSLQINRSLKSQQSSMRGVRIFFIEYKIRFYANTHTSFIQSEHFAVIQCAVPFRDVTSKKHSSQ